MRDAPVAIGNIHDRFRVRDARRRTENDRRVELLAHVVRDRHQINTLLRVGWLDAWHFGKARILAIVLLVLRTPRAGIVRADDDESAVDAGVREIEQRFARDVKPDMLHRSERARARIARARRRIERDFFVWRPLRAHVRIFREVFENLRRGRAGVRARISHAGEIRAERDGFVAGKQFLHYHLLKISPPRREERKDFHFILRVLCVFAVQSWISTSIRTNQARIDIAFETRIIRVSAATRELHAVAFTEVCFLHAFVRHQVRRRVF